MKIEVYVNTETHEVISSDEYRDKMNAYISQCIGLGCIEDYLQKNYTISQVYWMEEDEKEEVYEEYISDLHLTFSEDSDWVRGELEI